MVRVQRSSEIRFNFPTDSAVLAQIIELGDGNNKTLGFLPYAGFRSAFADGRIAVAVQGDRVHGYCLFDLPRDVVRIVQVCVSEDARGAGLSRALVDAVSDKHSDRLGLVLKCRADWPADKMWPKLEFDAQTQVPGRGKKKLPLTVWWRSHGHADLFTLLDEYKAVGRSAAIDSNVYSDLHSARKRQGAEHSAVLAPLIAGLDLNIVLLPTVDEEIYATSDPSERKRFLDAKMQYTRVLSPHAEEIVEHLLAEIPTNEVSKDDSLRHDAQLVAEAYANDVDLFITRDRNAIDHLTEPAADLGVEILHPSEVPTFLDVDEAHHAYQPAQLEETTFSIKRLDRPLSSNEVAELLDRAGGEKLSHLRTALAELAGASTANVKRSVLLDGELNMRAAWATRGSAADEVPLLRIPNGPLQTTLAAQLSRILRVEARIHGGPVLRVTDRHVPKPVRTVLEGDGFEPSSHGLAALSVPMIGTWAAVASHVRGVAVEHGTDPTSRLAQLPDDPSPIQTAEFERLWTPVKILGQGITNFLVPIKPVFASQLLGYPASLVSRPDDLGLSREHVYYSARKGPLKVPSRILWYVSGKFEQGVIATSNLVEVRVDIPRRLHNAYGRLGVWELGDIVQAAPTGKAAALRFVDTEMFATPVGLDRTRALVTQGQTLLLRSAQQLDDESYMRVYREGVQR